MWSNPPIVGTLTLSESHWDVMGRDVPVFVAAVLAQAIKPRSIVPDGPIIIIKYQTHRSRLRVQQVNQVEKGLANREL